MFRKFLIIGLFALIWSIPAVVRADVRVDLDRHKDFSRYRTFSVEIGDLIGVDGKVDESNTLAEDRIHRAVVNELAARGIEPAEGESQLIVRVSGRNAERTEILSRGFNGPYYWHRRYGYWRSPFRYWGSYYDDVWTRRYVEGSLTIDVVERDTGALVYRARVTEEVRGDQDKQVAKAIDKAFNKFPIKEIGN